MLTPEQSKIKREKEKLFYVRILIGKETHKRLKVASAKSSKTLLNYIDELSKIKI